MPTSRSDLVPRWAVIAAWAVPVAALPSAGWRFVTAVSAMAGDGNPCIPGEHTVWEALYPPALSVLQLGAALLTVGLVRPWGEVFPRWLPWLGGRRVPVTFAAGVAVAGAIYLAVSLLVPLLDPGPALPVPAGCEIPGWDGALRFYLPLYLWPPLLLAVTAHYVYRRRAGGVRHSRSRR
ncbi:hypothetical protein [Amycolatopsis suaedae]|uniref:DUF3995 domain-containing protein n=1 Tax=Amycolatopsis suaedae TaxID=2510978 RepID=A0A4Q7J5D4_9PSEU|nr:hypothetical protein [Amycolatopsis suaedae]RZQ62307.1 hypothetical protein EWH70_18695 [Amycolatopsis suaedae]